MKLYRCKICMIVYAWKSGSPRVCLVCKKKNEFEEVELELSVKVS